MVEYGKLVITQEGIDQLIRSKANVYIAGLRVKCREQGLAFNLTVDWYVDKLKGGCELSGVPFVWDGGGHGPKPQSQSVDRVVPELGYTQDNCRMVLFAYNIAKGINTDGDLKERLSAIIDLL